MDSDSIDIFYKGHTLKINYFLRPGTQKTIVYLHGLGCAKEDFLGSLDNKRLKDSTIFAYDFPGCGKSDYPSGINLGVDDLVTFTDILVKHFSLNSFVLVGHSMGGLVALLYAEKYSGKVAGFVNVEGNLASEDCFFSLEVVGKSFENFEHEIYPSIKERVAKKENKGFQEYRKELDQTSPRAYFDYCPSMTDYSVHGNLVARLLALPQPKLFMYGEQNKNLSYIPKLRQGMNVEVEEVPGSNHWPGYDNPEFYYESITKFIQSL